jgi:hypothetical protein
MSNQSAPTDLPLQFDTAHPSGAAPPAACASCKEHIRGVYYEANGNVLCSRCRGKLEAQLSSSGGMRRFRRAFSFGLGAAVAGAVVYYGFGAITGINFGLIGVLVGFMVGKAVFVGTDRRGGRRYQVLAVVLTYFAIASTYVPQVFKEAKAGMALSRDSSKAGARRDSSVATTAVADSNATPADSIASVADAPVPAATGKVPAKHTGLATYLILFAGVIILAAALPIVAGMGSIISVVILVFGLIQAWRMNRAIDITVNGPYRIAGLPIEGEPAT